MKSGKFRWLRLTGAPQTADKDRTVQQLQKKLLTLNGRCDHVLLAVAIYNWLNRRLLQLSHRLQLLPKRSRPKAKVRAKEKGKEKVRRAKTRYSPSKNSWQCPKRRALASFRCLKEPRVFASPSKRRSVPTQHADAHTSAWVAAVQFRTTTASVYAPETPIYL